MNPISIRLSIMMFVQFFVWGAWYVTAPNWLGNIGFVSGDIGNTYSVGPIAGMISPFFLGMIADRFFATERVLGVMHLLGAGFMFLAARQMDADYVDPSQINLYFLCHMLCYMPTLALTNTLALHNMKNAEKEFPLIRVFGTLGWIVAGVAISWFAWDKKLEMFYLAAGAGAFLGLYSFTLPHTPPQSKGKEFSAREALGIDAFVLLKKPSYFIFMLCSFLICIPLAFYYQLTSRFVGFAGFEKVGAVMSSGQGAEVVFMVLMPLCFARLGVKKMLLIGMLAWVIRYGLFAFASGETPIGWAVVAGVLLHGICYDFFFVTGQIYTDQAAPKKIRGQAQGMLVLFTLGIGMFIGAKIGGYVEGEHTNETAKALQAQAGELGTQFAAKRDSLAGLSEEQAAPIKAELKTLSTQIAGINEKAAAEPLGWKNIWVIPMYGAAGVLILFFLLFRDPPKKEDGDEEDDDGGHA